jgi:hypothetical protein
MKSIIQLTSNLFKKTSSFKPTSLFQNILNELQNDKSLSQDQVDTCKGALLLKCHEWYKTHATQTPPQNIINDIIQSIENTDKKTLKTEVQNLLNIQIEEMFNHIDSSTNALENTSPEIYTEELNNLLMHKIGFTLDVKKSGIKNADYGVFINGTYISPGTVVAIFPGRVHLPEFLTDKYLDAHIFPDDHYYVMGRYKCNHLLM